MLDANNKILKRVMIMEEIMKAKVMKRVSAFMLAIAMVFTSLSLTSFAEENPTIYEKPKTGRITINDATGIAGGTYTIKYSTSSSSCSNSSMTPVTVTVNEGDLISYSEEISIVIYLRQCSL